MIYAFFFLGCSALAFFWQYSRGSVSRIFWFTFLTLFLIILPGLRSYNVGTDTGNYVGIYEQFYSSNTGLEFIFNYSLEIGFTLLMFFASGISDSPTALLFICSIVFCLTIMFSFKRLNRAGANSLLLVISFLGLGSYFFIFNGARQGIAASFVWLGFSFLLTNNIKKYLVCCIAAMLFHSTAVVALAFIIFRTRFTFLRATLAAGAVVIGFGMLATLLPFLFSDSFEARYAVYITRSAQGGTFVFLFYLINALSILSLLFKYSSRFAPYTLNILNWGLVVLSSIALSVFAYSLDVNFYRLLIYLDVFIIFGWAIILPAITSFRGRLLVYILFGTVFLIYMTLYTNRFSDLVPYSLVV
jgi:hypothetical protein